jgi:5-methylcytosine-specific restriction enzyme subunit McrC
LAKPVHHITVFEHATLRFDTKNDEGTSNNTLLKALQSYHGAKGVPFFSLIHNGVRFNEHVGVIQVGNTLIEVLPKADKGDDGEERWRGLLIGMLKAVGAFDIRSTSSSHLKIKHNTVLDLYFETFINEIEYILHQGLIKQYRQYEGNVLALQGSLMFAQHIQQNLTHQERFYVRHTIYDVQHTLHRILYKALKLLDRICTNTLLRSRIATSLMHYPEMTDIKITPAVFERLSFTRKSHSYRKAIDLAKHILLQYHPDVSRGHNDVLALMFDMNMLWEKFVFMSLKRSDRPDNLVAQQVSTPFWKPAEGRLQKMRPDIVIKNSSGQSWVLDTKWKNLGSRHPSPEDLRQMYTYHEFFGARKVALIYPGALNDIRGGDFQPTPGYNQNDKQCSVITVAAPANAVEKSSIKSWQKAIEKQINDWLQLTRVS